MYIEMYLYFNYSSYNLSYICILLCQVVIMVKDLPANAGDLRDMNLILAWSGKVLLRREWQPTPVFSPGESHIQRSLVGYSP